MSDTHAFEPMQSAQSEGAPTASANSPSWQEQDGQLRDMWMQNKTPQDIANALGRSVPAIMTRAARLGLPRRAAPGRKPGRRLMGEKSHDEMSSLAPVSARPRGASPTAAEKVQVSQSTARVCLMCLSKFESAGRHNRICSSCKNSAEYESASSLPDISIPSV